MPNPNDNNFGGSKITQAIIDRIADSATFRLDINPRQVLANNLGVNTYEGGGNIEFGESADDLDRIIRNISFFTSGAQPTTDHSAFDSYAGPDVRLDIGVFQGDYVPATITDIQNLRAAFFARYGLLKKNSFPGPPQGIGNPL
jgi:hypothetical protein